MAILVVLTGYGIHYVVQCLKVDCNSMIYSQVEEEGLMSSSSKI